MITQPYQLAIRKDKIHKCTKEEHAIMLNAKTLIKQHNGPRERNNYRTMKQTLNRKWLATCGLSNLTNRGTQCRSNAKYLFLQNCYLENIIDKLNNITT